MIAQAVAPLLAVLVVFNPFFAGDVALQLGIGFEGDRLRCLNMAAARCALRCSMGSMPCRIRLRVLCRVTRIGQLHVGSRTRPMNRSRLVTGSEIGEPTIHFHSDQRPAAAHRRPSSM